jgi:nucleoporin NDC1
MAIFVSIFHSALAVIGGMLFFGIARVTLPVLYGVPFFSIFLRPFTAHFLKGSWTIVLFFYHARLVIRAFFLSFSTFLVWEITDNLFDRVITEVRLFISLQTTAPLILHEQRIVLSRATSDSDTTLVSGATSSDHVFKFFAYSELRDLAMEDSPKASSRRTALFGDQTIVPNLWSCLCRESLLILGNHYQLLLHRGSQPPSSNAPLPNKLKTTPTPDIGTPTKLLRQSIYKNVKESPGQAALDALGSDGPIAQAFEAGADATHIPELFRSVESKVLTSPAAEEAKKNVEHVKGAGSKLNRDCDIYCDVVCDTPYSRARQGSSGARRRVVESREVEPESGSIIGITRAGCYHH